MSAAAAAPILLSCPSVSAEACGALADQLADAYPDRTVQQVTAAGTDLPPGTLYVTLQMSRNETHVIAGRLSWTSSGPDATGTGPEVETSTDDAPLPAGAWRDFANGLLQVTPLPGKAGQ